MKWVFIDYMKDVGKMSNCEKANSSFQTNWSCWMKTPNYYTNKFILM